MNRNHSLQKQIVFALLFFVGVVSSCASSIEETQTGLTIDGIRKFYVDSSTSTHRADGSMEYPFKKLEDLRNVEFQPGDTIFLAGNRLFKGSIQIAGVKGTLDLPIVITSYGKGIAQICSDAASAITLNGCEHFQIKDVAVKGKGRKKGNQGNGIEVIDSRNIQIDCVEASGYLKNGIRIVGGENIHITHAYVHDNGFSGIEVTGHSNEKRVLNVYIGYCIAENNPGCPVILDNHSGNGILVGHASHVLVEYCEAMENGWDMPRSGNGPVGIWGYETDHLIIQYCYSHDNKTSVSGHDGGGFDFDGGITNSIMRYNLSMNNEGAGYGLFQYPGASEWSNNVIQYNISINDGRKNSHAGIYVWCDPQAKVLPLSDTRVHDNLIINREHCITLLTAHSSNLQFIKNKFLLTETATEHFYGDESMKLPLFKGNSFWSQKAEHDGASQPQVALDNEAVYDKIDYMLPEKIEILRLKGIVSDLIFGTAPKDACPK